MNKQDRLMDYLYGELDEAARRRFEEELAADPALRAELEDFRRVRQFLGALPDVRPQPALVTLPAPAWKKWGLRVAVAAGLLLLLSLLHPRLEVSPGGMVLSLGRPATPAATEAAPAGETQMAAIIRRLEDQDKALNHRLALMDSTWQTRLAGHEQALARQWETRWQTYQARRTTDLQQLAQQVRQDSGPELADLIQNLQIKQQQELQLLLEAFWDHYQQSRQSDLQSIQREFVDLYRNVAIQQDETATMLRNFLNGNI